MKYILTFLLSLLAILSPWSACQAEPLRVVASFSILADMAREIGGEAVTVGSLVGPDQDMHSFQPTPGDIKKLAKAQLIIVNGLGFEGWLQRAIKASGAKSQVIIATAGIMPLTFKHNESHGHGHDGATYDPHAWQDVSLARIYAQNIAAGLQAAVPDQADSIEKRAKAYDAKLVELDIAFKHGFAAIPAERRIIVTNHDAFGYFAKAYGVEVRAPLGVGNESTVKASDLVALQKQIKAEGIKVVFLENFANPKLMQQLASDTGVVVGGVLYTDALSDASGPAANYLAMMQHNATAMQTAMR